MSSIQLFDRRDAVYEPFRTAGAGHQSVCEWVGPSNGGRYQAGIAKLEHIRITDYVFAFDDFLYVLEGEIIISDEELSVSLKAGQAVFIPERTKVTMEVPNRLVWTYVAYSDSLHWKDTLNEPATVEEV